jgi:hypothetical protein
MLFSDVLIGTVIGAILWPIVQQVVDSTNRAILGFIIGGLIGGALAWASVGLDAGQVIGSSIGANGDPVQQEIGLTFIDALIQTVRGGAIGAIIVLAFRSFSFVLVGAGIGLIISIFLSGGLRLLNQNVLDNPIPTYQITLIVVFGTFLIISFLSGQR